MINYFDITNLVISLLCHVIIFFGGLYVAVHSRKIPLWVSTFLWYIGVISLMICISILIHLIFGTANYFSYFNVGLILKMTFEIMISALIMTLFVRTLNEDLKNKTKRSDDRSLI